MISGHIGFKKIMVNHIEKKVENGWSLGMLKGIQYGGM